MTTVIKINGLDVEFSEKVPTKPGVYWWKAEETDYGMIRQVTLSTSGELCCIFGAMHGSRVRMIGGLWSSPLVPAVEVARAYAESQNDLHAELQKDFANPFTYEKSRAKRVAEGGE